MINYRPYSLYAYGQVDGRHSFQYRPQWGKNMIVCNVTQLDILWNEQFPDTECVLVFLSYIKGCKLCFDARYMVPEFDDILEEGSPFVVGIRNGLVEVEELDANLFHGGY